MVFGSSTGFGDLNMHTNVHSLHPSPGPKHRAAFHKRLWRPYNSSASAQRGEAGLPKVSEFFGISIYLYWGDHEPAHFHARYAGFKASIAIADLTLLRGELPPRALGLVMEWAAIHQGDLQDAWRRVINHEPPGSIEPLR
ncbi:MAG: DUF4160 domain-containing protein [Gemmatimonadota bacterium]